MTDVIDFEKAKERRQRYRLLTPEQLLGLPPATWLVKNVLPARGLAVIYGASGSGKSFLAMDLGIAIAEGADWFGHRVDQRPVAYLHLEGQTGVINRLRAWQTAKKRTIPEEFRTIVDTFVLTNDRDLADLGTALKELTPGMCIFVDTLNRATPFSDENAAKDMGRIIDCCAKLSRYTGGLVTLVHHTGKDLEKGLRGHSSLHGALDACIEVRRDDLARSWRLIKSKEGNDSIEAGFWLDVVDLGEDSDGDPITSCIVRPDLAPPVRRGPKRPTGNNQVITLREIQRLLGESTVFGQGGAPELHRCVRYSEAMDAAIAAMPVDTTAGRDRRRDRVKEAIDSLIASANLNHREGWIWLA